MSNRVVICFSCLPREQGICSRYQKVRDTEYSGYRESTVLTFEFATNNTAKISF